MLKAAGFYNNISKQSRLPRGPLPVKYIKGGEVDNGKKTVIFKLKIAFNNMHKNKL